MTLSMLTAASPSESYAPPLPVRITKSLLGYGVIAGPIYVGVSVAQGLTRDGFDFTRHAWSLLANGDLGWIQVANFTLTGLMLVAFAVGMRRALQGGRGGTWAPLLMGIFGVGMILSVVFRADPALGFPPGAPEQPEMTLRGALHYPVAGVGFISLVAAFFVLASRYAAEGRRGRAVLSRLVGLAFLAGFAAMIASGGAAWGVVSFTIGILAIFTWVSATAVDLYRRAG